MDKEILSINVDSDVFIEASLDKKRLNAKDRKNLAFALKGLILTECYAFNHGIEISDKELKLIFSTAENGNTDFRRKTYNLQLYVVNNTKYLLKEKCRYLSKHEILHVINLIHEEHI